MTPERLDQLTGPDYLGSMSRSWGAELAAEITDLRRKADAYDELLPNGIPEGRFPIVFTADIKADKNGWHTTYWPDEQESERWHITALSHYGVTVPTQPRPFWVGDVIEITAVYSKVERTVMDILDGGDTLRATSKGAPLGLLISADKCKLVKAVDA